MLAVCVVVVAVDQVAKAVVTGSMALGERSDLALGFELTRVTNSGIAFGFLDDGGDALVLAITLGALALILGWFTFDTTRPWLWLGVGMLVGGALGNLIDRIREGAVTDFIDPPLWPAFNLADGDRYVGVAIIALSALSPEPRPGATEP